MTVKPIEWLGDRIKILDQTRLPLEEVYLETDDYLDVCKAIKQLVVRGAPSIGVAGGYAIALGALKISADSRETFIKEYREVSQAVAGTRPTARNLFFAVERMDKITGATGTVNEIKQALVNEAVKIHTAEAEATIKLSSYGAELIVDGFTVLTHCNAGPLATTGYGTALGVIIKAKEQGKNVRVYADETRPLLQGARLTTWELQQAGVPVTLITDSMAGHMMKQGKIDCVITGADRIAANGDTANKIGTYTLAILAKEHNIPLYIAAPFSTIDTSLKTGDEIPIEERNQDEVTHFRGVQTAPYNTVVENPAFDVTPHRYITAIITERGIIREPFREGVTRLDNKQEEMNA
ncbi:MAG: S-methyl-5-thioribose-1-phosphate isomerase [Dehalococcoidales bacterium]|nr:MAG: S-methyl-5-thioribose-1-phosphate isomerase [Dehalococcoidales bacterium]